MLFLTVNCWYTIMWDSWWCWLASREVTENWSMSRGWRTRGHEDRPIYGAGPGPGLTGGTGCTSLPLDCPRNLPQSLLSISNPSQLKIIAELSQLHGGIYLWWSNWYPWLWTAIDTDTASPNRQAAFNHYCSLQFLTDRQKNQLVSPFMASWFFCVVYLIFLCIC